MSFSTKAFSCAFVFLSSVLLANDRRLPLALIFSSPGIGALNFPTLAVDVATLYCTSLTNCLLFKLFAPTPPPLSPPFLPPPPLLLLLLPAPIANLNVAGNAAAPFSFTCSPKFRLLCISFFSTLAFLSFLSFKNGSSVWPARLESFASTMAIFVESFARSYPCLLFHSSCCSSNTILLLFLFLIPFSSANCSHFVFGFSMEGKGKLRGNFVSPGGKSANLPFTSDSDGNANKSLTNRCNTSLACALMFSSLSSRVKDPTVRLNFSRSKTLVSETKRFPTSTSTAPVYASVASSVVSIRNLFLL
mmetsp:Transcript_6752/g.21008  ORF Transcript_6752/g.21008 Transcript_6752/m.21008 type:complete len:304 (+) Transcript_6752:285-1196(+)